MVTRKNTVEGVTIDPDTGELLTPGLTGTAGGLSLIQTDDEPSPDDVAIADILGELGGADNASVRIYRQGKGGYRDQTFLFECTPGEFSLTMLQEEPYNGGDFRVYIRKGQERLANRLVKVASRNFTPKVPTVDIVAPITQLAEVMSKGFLQLGEMITRTQQQPPAANPAPTLLEMVQTLQSLQGITGGNKPDNSMEMLLKGIELAKSLTPREGGSSDNDVLMGLVDRLGPPIMEGLMKEKGNAPLQSQSTTPLLPVGTPGGSPVPSQGRPIRTDVAENPLNVGNHAGSPTPSMTAESPEMMQTMMIKQAVGFLVSQAARNNDPMTYANMVIDQVPADVVTQIIDAPDWFERLAGFNPKVREYPGWFEELRTCIREILTGEPGPGTSPENTPGQPDAAIGST